MSAGTDLLRHPDALFGMLLAAEGGASVSRMAELYGLARDQMAGVLELARRGDCPRVPASDGTLAQVSTAKGKNHGPVADDHEEVLLQRWMRRISRHLARHGEISLNQVRELVGNSGDTASVHMDQLRHRLKTIDISFESETRGGRFDLFYVITGESRERLRAIIAAGWKVEVAQ